MTKNIQRKRTGGSPLTLGERSIIEVRWCRDYKGVTDIAKELGRNKSSVSRELAGKPRIGRGRYNADTAHRKALLRIGNRGNTPKTQKSIQLKTYIETKLINERWSPEQVSIRLPVEFPLDNTMRIAPESIYSEIYRRVHRGGNGTIRDGEIDLRSYLARLHTRRAKKGFRKAQKMERDRLLPSIDIRPSVVAERSRIGDWKDDTMLSHTSTVRIKNVTERRSGVTLFGKTVNGTAEACDAVLIKALGRLPAHTRITLTRDRGSENVRHREVTATLGLDVFYAHAYASYERGTNENTNGLLRRFLPKKTDFSHVSDEELKRIEYLLNTRPRKRLGGLTPVEVFLMETGVAVYS
ncbi:MAG: IS30 family transposase [Candidatus Yonathbacteria bacterium]|nr:IS30 family transposase [Candidatus Yonathbacteria bacterium]NTW47677.1 IS30 family transposase [Candidatus Yonathbacteria bacterium]